MFYLIQVQIASRATVRIYILIAKFSLEKLLQKHRNRGIVRDSHCRQKISVIVEAINALLVSGISHIRGTRAPRENNRTFTRSAIGYLIRWRSQLPRSSCFPALHRFIGRWSSIVVRALITCNRTGITYRQISSFSYDTATLRDFYLVISPHYLPRFVRAVLSSRGLL